MDKNTKDKIDVGFKSVALIGSAIAFSFTIWSWLGQLDIKRSEFLEYQIKDFDDASSFVAISILDRYAVPDTMARITDQELVAIGSSRKGVKSDITLDSLEKALGEPFPSTNFSRQRVRRSFDDLLDFFGKLEYYLSLGLMTENEVNYFKYYIEKCSKDKAIMAYATKYDFILFQSLVNRLDLQRDK